MHTHTHTFNGPLSRTTRVSQYQKGKTILDFTEARDSEWQWHQLGHMQVCTSLQTDASTHHSFFYRPDALPATQPTASKHWRQGCITCIVYMSVCLSVIHNHELCQKPKAAEAIEMPFGVLTWVGQRNCFWWGLDPLGGRAILVVSPARRAFVTFFGPLVFFYNATWNWMTCNVLMYHKQIVNLNMMARKTEATVFDFHIC